MSHTILGLKLTKLHVIGGNTKSDLVLRAVYRDKY